MTQRVCSWVVHKDSACFDVAKPVVMSAAVSTMHGSETYLRARLLAVAARHIPLVQEVSGRITASRERTEPPAAADQAFLRGWLQVLEVLAVTTCNQRHPELKALAARLDELRDDVRRQLL